MAICFQLTNGHPENLLGLHPSPMSHRNFDAKKLLRFHNGSPGIECQETIALFGDSL